MKLKNKTLNTMIRFLKPYLKHSTALVVFMIMVAIIDGLFPYMNKYAIDNFVVPQNYEGIKKFSFYYLGLMLWQVVNVYAFIYIAGYIKNTVSYDIRKKAFEKLQHLSFSYYDKTAVGWIMARMTSDVERLGEAVSWSIVDFVWGIALTLVYMIMMLVINYKLALISFVVIPLLGFATVYFQKKMLDYSRKSRSINSKITGAFNEGIMGAKATKTLAREREALGEFKEITSDMKYASMRVQVTSSIYLPIVIGLGSIGTSLVLWAGGNGVIYNAITYGTLVAFMAYTMKFYEPIQQIARIFAEFQRQYASMERVMQLINEEISVKDYGDHILTDFKGDIKFEDVEFKYDGGEKVLDAFNLHIKSGETIALVGETGSGKSTIVNLACRFYEPTSGNIKIDGIDYKDIDLQHLQGNLGYVLQKPHLFSGTIKENIAYGIEDISEERVVEAAKLVNAHSFIMKMKNGYDSEVGEGGNRLSTGEKQLISFARAILANPKIFVLDEATSSIDAHTEKLIQDAIEKVIKNRTSFIIAHRLSTIRNADKILVIKKGKIIEEGTHKELLNEKGYYHNLYLKQFKEDREKEFLVV